MKPDLNDARATRIRELDGWRGVSVLLVILHHIAAYQHARILTHYPDPFSVVLYAGHLGVKMFFVISGFVICRLLILEEQRSVCSWRQGAREM